MVEIEQVKYWHVWQGIGHVVATNHGDGWLDLACNTVCTGNVTEDRPARICRKCRERMKDAEPVSVPCSVDCPA